jgi:hypothetical protein
VESDVCMEMLQPGSLPRNERFAGETSRRVDDPGCSFSQFALRVRGGTPF